MDELLDHAPCGFLSFTDAGAIVEINSTLLEMLGYHREDMAVGQLGTILTIGSRVFCQTHLLPMLRIHGRLDEIYLILRQKNGSELGVLINVARRERRGIEVNDCVVLGIRDRQMYEEELLRAKKAAEDAHAALAARQEQLRAVNQALVEKTEELNRQRSVAEEANRAKSAFLSFMSHELRTPLTAVMGFGQLLQLSELPVEDAESVEQILKAGRHLLDLINEVLDLATIEAGRFTLFPEPVPVDEVVRHSVALVRMSAAERGIEIRPSEAPGAERYVLADRKRLQQVVLNLLSNAIKYNRVGGRIEIRYEEGASGTLLIQVADTGYGIPEESLDRLFAPFDRLGAEEGPVQGTGLGLALSRKLVEAMGGRIGADSVLEEGSIFWIELPSAELEVGAE